VPESAVITSLDVRGLLCPEPLIKLGEAMRSLRSGDRLEVLADDPVAPLDFAAFCHRTGHPMRESTKESSWFRFVIEHR
jgi:tRNA 2-thiouridine synthesizing protein A